MNFSSLKNWKTATLGNIAEIVGGGTPSTKESYFWDGDIPWITPKDLSGYESIYIEGGERHITEEGLKNSSVKLLPKNSILFSSRAPIGYIAINKIPVTTNQGFKSLIPNEGVDYKFLYYWLLCNKGNIEKQASGSTFAEVSGSVMKNINITLPASLDEQKEIADLLGSLDDKIELLRKENKTLETVAQTLFKEWFVDFRFPGYQKLKMINGIPEGWKIGKLGDVAFVTKGTTPTTIGGKFVDKGINFIKAESITEQHGFNLNKFSFVDEYTNKLLNRSIIQVDDLLYTIAGTIGRFALITKDLTPANTNQAVAIIRANQGIIDPYYLRCYFDIESVKESLTGSVVEAVQANLSLGSIKECEILIPNNEGIKLFIEKIKPLFFKADLHNTEIKTLSKLRDDLLNKIFNL